MDIGAFLATHGIVYDRFDHPAVFTCEESLQLDRALTGINTKNLFLRDKNDTRHFLVVVPHEKSADLKALTKVFGVSKLSFGSPERLLEFLGVTPGSVTLLGLVNDLSCHVEVFIDQAIWDAATVCCHPLVNTATVCIPHAGIETLLHTTGHAYSVIDVPARSV
jgi:Ala-tRNA(Pro) deacylase